MLLLEGFLSDELNMAEVAGMIDGATSDLRDIVDKLTPVTIDIVGKGEFINTYTSENFNVLSNQRRFTTYYRKINDLVRRKRLNVARGNEFLLRKAMISEVYLNLDHNFRVGDESSDISAGGVKIVLESCNLYVGVGIYVDCHGEKLIQPIGRSNKDTIRKDVIRTLANHL